MEEVEVVEGRAREEIRPVEGPLYDDEAWWSTGPLSHGAYMLGLVQYYGLPALLLVALVASLFYLLSSPPATPSDELTAAELQELVAQERAFAREGMPPVASPRGSSERTQLTVYSAPSGATVLVDFKPVGSTPLIDHELEAGVYVVSLRAESFAPVDTVVFTRDVGVSGLFIALTDGGEDAPPMQEPDLRPEAVSRGSQGRLEVERAGRELPDVPTAGRGEAVATAAAPAEKTQGEQPRQTVAAAEAGGTLLVTSDPSGAIVRLAGDRVGATPLHLSGVSPGSHRLTVELEGFRDTTLTAGVDPAQEAFHHVSLKPITARLTVLVRPWGTIYIDGRLHRRGMDVAYTTSLRVGTHEVSVVHPVLGEMTRTVEVRRGASQTVVFDLKESSELPPVDG